MGKRTVKKGDYLIKIAREEGVTLKELIAANPQISDPNLIHPGDSINVPSSEVPSATTSGDNYTDENSRALSGMQSPSAAEEAGESGPTGGEPVSEPPEPGLKRFIKGHHGKYHKEHEEFISGDNGLSGSILSEPVPEFFARPGDGILTATEFSQGASDNNTMIILGRDRTGLGEIDSADPNLVKSDSGYSSYMGAGAIDIVVGRCSPFPLSMEGKTWSPLFNTQKKIPELRMQTLEGIENNTPFFTFHPGYVMDAARIYISQMTDIDESFKIQKKLFFGGSIKQKTNKRTPCSGIMLKADKIRMHSRSDVKIVTGGPHETVNSQGNDITEVGGIHLMAGNQSSNQQPIPLGDNLARVLDQLVDKVDDLASIVFSLAHSQMKFNNILGTHCHQSPMYGISTTPSLTAAPASVEAVLNQFSRVTNQIVYLQRNLSGFRGNYLRYGSGHYINSSYNTTN